MEGGISLLFLTSLSSSLSYYWSSSPSSFSTFLFFLPHLHLHVHLLFFRSSSFNQLLSFLCFLINSVFLLFSLFPSSSPCRLSAVLLPPLSLFYFYSSVSCRFCFLHVFASLLLFLLLHSFSMFSFPCSSSLHSVIISSSGSSASRHVLLFLSSSPSRPSDLLLTFCLLLVCFCSTFTPFFLLFHFHTFFLFIISILSLLLSSLSFFFPFLLPLS